jgi:F0F1-type ATP synthase assembly protein I
MNRRYLVFIAMGFELVGLILACLLIGQWLDDRYHLKGFGVLGLTIIGLVGWMVHLVQLLKQSDDESP